jgi:hypothetical protein
MNSQRIPQIEFLSGWKDIANERESLNCRSQSSLLVLSKHRRPTSGFYTNTSPGKAVRVREASVF